MVSSLECPLRAESASLSLPATGSASVTKVTVPLVYTGPTPSKVLTFAAKSAGEAVELELGYPECPAPWKGVVKLTGARLELPAAGTEGKPKVRLTVVLARDDTREPRELLGFLLDGAAALELEAKAVVVQAPLPFPSDEEDGDDLGEPLPGEKPRRTRG
jgi:hypothetical protein